MAAEQFSFGEGEAGEGFSFDYSKMNNSGQICEKEYRCVPHKYTQIFIKYFCKSMSANEPTVQNTEFMSCK